MLALSSGIVSYFLSVMLRLGRVSNHIKTPPLLHLFPGTKGPALFESQFISVHVCVCTCVMWESFRVILGFECIHPLPPPLPLPQVANLTLSQPAPPNFAYHTLPNPTPVEHGSTRLSVVQHRHGEV